MFVSTPGLVPMLAVSLGMFIIDVFKSRRRLEAENLFLRPQLDIALRHAPPRLRLHGCPSLPVVLPFSA